MAVAATNEMYDGDGGADAEEGDDGNNDMLW